MGLGSDAWDRTFRELPERESDQNRTGVAFVAVLFSLVVGKIAEKFIDPVQLLIKPPTPLPNPDWRWVAVAHYSVGLVLTVTSFVGYFASKNGPQLRIKFFNLPFVQIVLDSTMVIAYFFLATYAETEKTPTPDARPEAYIVALSMLLYVVWDAFGYRIAKDPLSALARGKEPEKSYGPRRWVTVAFFVVFAGVAVLAWQWGELRRDATTVIWFDLLLIALLLFYRVFKSVFDTNGIKTRSRPLVPISFNDWSRIVPSAVVLDRATFKQVVDHDPELSKDKNGSPIESGLVIALGDTALRAALERLHKAGAVQLKTDPAKKEEVATLTDSGRAYAHETDPAWQTQ